MSAAVELPLGHQTWFLERSPELGTGFFGEGATLALLGAAVAITIGVRLIASVWPGVDVPWLARLAPWMPFAVRMHLAVSLVGLLSLGVYLAPSMDLETDFAGIALGTVMALVAIGMATGYRARAAAWLLVAAGPLGMLEFGVWAVVQRIDLLGLAIFVLLIGPGRWSADHERGATTDRFRPDGLLDERGLRAASIAILALRIAAGAGLIAVALYEKLLQPEFALEFLAEHPDLQVARELGIGLSDLEFVRVAGAIEVLFGLLLISGGLPQVIVIAAGIPFNATLWFFGVNELLGHLPIYAAMLVILVFGSHPQLRSACSGWGGARLTTASPGAVIT